LATHPRLWHYRIYDTVSDPDGLIRELLEAYGEIYEDRVFTGEANLRVQGYVPRSRPPEPPQGAGVATFGRVLALHVPPCCGVVARGQSAFGELFWQVHEQPGADYATSLRLVGPHGRIWNQPPDERPLGALYSTSQWLPGTLVRQPLAVPVPPDTPPGTYSLELVLYDPATGDPVPVAVSSSEGLPVKEGTRLQWGTVEVVLPAEEPVAFSGGHVARWGPLELLEAQSPATIVRAGDAVPVDLRWRAQRREGVEDVVVVLQLLADLDAVVASREEEPVDGRFPATQWPAGRAVRDMHALIVPAGTRPGRYRLIVALDRASDHQRLPARSGLLDMVSRDYITLQHVEVVS